MSKESFGEHYDRVLREEFGNRRVHVMTSRIHPRNLAVGAWAMYLPLEITEGMSIMPRMARVTKIRHEGGQWYVDTELGIMVLQEGEQIQVVT